VIIKHGGEGALLRKPLSLYEAGKSHAVLKVKGCKDDDALVLSITSKKYKCQLPNGKIMFCSKKRKMVANQKITTGDVISYEFLHISQTGLPINPVIRKIRHDVVWQDILMQHNLMYD